MSFRYIPVTSKLHDKRSLSDMLVGHEKALAALGGARLDGAVADGEDVAFTFVQTGGVESDVIRRYRSRMQQGKTGPVLLIAHPAHKSLPAALEILAQVQQENGSGRIYLLKGKDDAATLAEIAQTARCMEATDAAFTFCGHVHAQRLYFEARPGKTGEFEPRPGTAIPVTPARRWLAIVGSVGQPRDGRTAAQYAIYDTTRHEITFHRVAYDAPAAAARIRAAGLPEALSYRVEAGI